MVQYHVLDFLSFDITVGFVLAVPSPQLHPDARPRRLFSALVLAPIVMYATIYAVEQGIAQLLVKQASAGDADHLQVSTANI